MKHLLQLTKKKIWTLSLLLIFIFLPLSIAGIKKLNDHFNSRSNEAFAMPVSTQRADTELWIKTLNSVGSVSADQGINVTASLPGIVDEIYFKSGDSVVKGSALVRQDTSILAAELKGLKAEQGLRQIQFNRTSKLIEMKKISKSEFDRSKALLKQADAMVKAKDTEIQLKTILAPFDGLLGIRQINIGTFLQPGDPIVQLSTISPVHVDFTLPEKHIDTLEIGLKTQIRVAAYPQQVFYGDITAINPLISVETRNVSIRSTFINENNLLKPGMYCEVNAIMNSKQEVITLPETAIFFTPYGNSVYVLEYGDDGARLKKKIVATGARKKGKVEIVDGVIAGEEVVVAGQNKLREGMLVTKVQTLKRQ